MKVSRRTFLKAGGAAGATVAIAGVTPPLLSPLFEERGGELPIAPLKEKWVPSVCLQCPAGCGILVRVVDGRAVKIEGNPLHPINEGRLCPKGQIGLQILYDPDRIKGPLRRAGERGSGQWQPISWDEAIAEVAGRLREIRDRGEPHTLVFMSGRNRGQMGPFIGRFLEAYGSPNNVGHSSICEDGSPQAHYLTQGFKQYAGYDWVNTNYVISFGGSFLEAWRPTTLLLRSYGHMRRGRPVRFKLVHVDSRYSVTATKADEWLPIRPGTDGALALALAHVIIRDKLYDQEFVQNHTHGFEEWSHLVLEEYTPEWAEAETGVSADIIVRLAREFATTRPAIAAGARGTSMQPYGVYTRTAIHALNALVGSIDVPGGVVVQLSPNGQDSAASPLTKAPDVVQDDIAKAGIKQPRIDYAGTKRYPLAGKVYQNMAEFATGQGPYKANALLLYYTNPVFSTPDVGRVYKMLEQVPFIVDFTPFMSETAEYADLILPDHTYLERWQDDAIYPSLGYQVIGMRQPVVEPVYDTRNSGDLLIQIAQAVGGSVAQSFPWPDFLTYLKFKFQGLYEAKKGTIVANSFDQFWQEFTNRGVWANPPYPFGQWERVFSTSSKKFEFVFGNLEHKLEELAEKEAEKNGTSAEAELEEILTGLKIAARGEKVLMPHYEAPRFAGDPEQYPLFLNTYKLMTHAEGRGANAPWLQEIHGVHLQHNGTRWDSWAELNPATARRLGIEDGDEVWVESVVGRLKSRARINPGNPPNVVAMPFEQGHRSYGRWAEDRGANPNWILVNEMDHLGGLAAFFSTRVKVYKA
jgi:anaerobic selenocysteine-containing dehydrogenase